MRNALRSVPLLLAAATLAVRIRTFSAPNDDGNVGLYLYVAHQWLSGSLPYTQAWEYKPPGLFALFAAGLAVFRNPGLASAVLSAAAVFAAALALYAIRRKYGGAQGSVTGAVAALFYIFLTTEDAGLAGEAQVYVAAFAAWAVYVCAFSENAARHPRRRALLTGLLAGLAVQMKLTALPVALLLAAVVAADTRPRSFALGLFAGGFALPIVPEVCAYAFTGHLAQLYDANVAASLRRLNVVGGAGPRAGSIRDALAQLRILAPAAELAPFALLKPRERNLWLLAAWPLCVLFTVLLSREYYERQFFELAAPLAILAAIGTVRLGTLLARPRAVAAVLLILTFALHDYYTIRKTLQTAYERRVAHDRFYNVEHLELLVAGLRAYTRGDRSIYVFQESPIVYLYLRTRPPTRYAFSADLLEPKLWPMLGFPGAKELQRIVAARPHYVLIGRPDGARDDPLVLAQFSRAVERNYRRVASIDGDPLYRLARRAK